MGVRLHERRDRVATIGVLLASCAISFIAAEAVVRVFMPEISLGTVQLSENPTLMYELTPGVWEHNGSGFRGSETRRTKAAGVFRIAVIGDTLTYGAGQLQWRASYLRGVKGNSYCAL